MLSDIGGWELFDSLTNDDKTIRGVCILSNLLKTATSVMFIPIYANNRFLITMSYIYQHLLLYFLIKV